jgi:hypothetical protein
VGVEEQGRSTRIYTFLTHSFNSIHPILRKIREEVSVSLAEIISGVGETLN